jgi:aryl-phospho-beta-D-glucosidase BglC (GH1 family)
MTNYLRFADEPTFRSAAFIAGLFNEPEGDNPGGYTQYTHDHAMDIVGTIYNDDAVVDPDGTVVTPATPMAGWHVNFVGALPTGWDAFLVSPVAPYRVFA